MNFVVAVELASDFESTKVAEGIDVGDSNAIVVLGEREVETGLRSTTDCLSCSGELDGVLNQDIFCVIRLIGSLDDDVSLNGWTPDVLCITQELDQSLVAGAKVVSDDDSLVRREVRSS